MAVLPRFPATFEAPHQGPHVILGIPDILGISGWHFWSANCSISVPLCSTFVPLCSTHPPKMPKIQTKNANNSINYLINSSLKSFVRVNSRGIISILPERFVSLPEEVKFRSISKLLKFVGKGKNNPRSKNILNIFAMYY